MKPITRAKMIPRIPDPGPETFGVVWMKLEMRFSSESSAEVFAILGYGRRMLEDLVAVAELFDGRIVATVELLQSQSRCSRRCCVEYYVLPEGFQGL